MSDDERVTVVSREWVEGQIESILTKHPMLRDVEQACCTSHTEDDVRDEHGWRVAQAWATLDELRWLAGP